MTAQDRCPPDVRLSPGALETGSLMNGINRTPRADTWPLSPPKSWLKCCPSMHSLSPQTTAVSEGLLLTHFTDGKTEAELRGSSSISRLPHNSTDEPLPWRSWPAFPRRHVGVHSHHARGPDEEAGTQRLP